MLKQKIELEVNPIAELKKLLLAAQVECDAGLLRAESSQAQFNTTRFYLRGRKEALTAIEAYLCGNPDALVALTRPG